MESFNIGKTKLYISDESYPGSMFESCHGIVTNEAAKDIINEFSNLNNYIKQLEAQIARDRESLIKEGEFVKKYVAATKEWINE